MIETARLALRNYRDDERGRFADLNADPMVGQWLGGTMTREASDAAFDTRRLEIDRDGFGLWAAALKADDTMIGSVGLRRLPIAWDHPMRGEVEVGWRLFPSVWGAGYASEAAAACLAFGFSQLGLSRIVSFTADTNAPSEAVMRRIGMTRDPTRDFDHPALAAGHPLRRHIVYSARRPEL
ncbi:MAG TPA: GNAT family N-acetyltransferase [Caulobacteraceae bacterium]